MKKNMVTRVNTKVPDDMLEFIQTRVKHGHFDNKSEYIRHLVRKDEEETKKKEISLQNPWVTLHISLLMTVMIF